VPSGDYRLGKAGRVNVNESSMMSRHEQLHRWVALVGYRDWPLENGRRRLGNLRQPGAHRRPRDPEGAHPGRVSLMRNVITPMGSRRQVSLVSRP
jgi:hypothetical protein